MSDLHPKQGVCKLASAWVLGRQLSRLCSFFTVRTLLWKWQQCISWANVDLFHWALCWPWTLDCGMGLFMKFLWDPMTCVGNLKATLVYFPFVSAYLVQNWFRSINFTNADSSSLSSLLALKREVQNNFVTVAEVKLWIKECIFFGNVAESQ